MVKSRSEDYWAYQHITVACKSRTSTFWQFFYRISIGFVQGKEIDEFEEKKMNGNAVSFRKNGGSNRFLVYNDKNNKP